MSTSLRVITSGALAKAVEDLLPEYVLASGAEVELSFGSSLGAAADSIPTRLRNGEQFDLLFLAEAAHGEYAASGLIHDRWLPLVESHIGAAVRVGAPVPDISTVEAFRSTLLKSGSVALAASASGIYLSTVVFPALGIDQAMKSIARTVYSERVGKVVARAEADLGFQQMSELLPIPGIQVIGRLPAKLARAFVFGAGFGLSETNRPAAEDFLSFMTSKHSLSVIRSTGLDPIVPSGEI